MAERRKTVAEAFFEQVDRAVPDCIDISKLIQLLKLDGVNVSGGEHDVSSQPLGSGQAWGIASTLRAITDFTYLVTYKDATIVIKYSKDVSNGLRRVNSIHINTLTMSTTASQNSMELKDNSIDLTQGNALLEACDMLKITIAARYREEQQTKFNAIFDSLAPKE